MTLIIVKNSQILFKGEFTSLREYTKKLKEFNIERDADHLKDDLNYMEVIYNAPSNYSTNL